MSIHYACGSREHGLARRQFLGTLAAAGTGVVAGGMGVFSSPLIAGQLQSDQKRIVVFNMHGGVSQLESWDPKPGTDTGGPFQAIPTSVPGLHISELLPYTATQMHHLAVIRGVNTKENNHTKGAYIMQTGRRETPGFTYPYLGSAFASLLGSPDSPLPGYIRVGRGGSAKEAAFLGPRYAPLSLNDGKAPPNLEPPGVLSPDSDARRRELRAKFSERFA